MSFPWRTGHELTRSRIWLILALTGVLSASHDHHDEAKKMKLPKEKMSDYIVIMDAGSTGTRAFAFHYKKRVINAIEKDFVVGKPLTIPEGIFSIQRSPGVSFYSRDPKKLLQYLQNICHDIAERLRDYDKHVKLHEVPIYLGATAGMRDLDKSAREAVFDKIRDALADTGFAFTHMTQARVLSGEEESAYDWLTVNHFHSHDGVIRNTWENTYGAVDMGGESVEIVFIPKDASIMAGLFPMHFGEFPGTIHLYTHSFMHYGQVAAFQRASRALWYEDYKDSNSSMEHPCLPRGLRWRVDDDTFGVATSGSATRKKGPIDVRGVGDFSKCIEVAKKLIYQAYCTQTPCSFLGVYQPCLQGVHFWLTGQFADVWKQLAIPGNELPALQALRDHATDFCNLTVADQAEFVERYGSGSTADRILLCWLAAWSYTMLVHGLKFEPDSLDIKADLREDVDWPIGAAIYHVNFYPYKVHFGKNFDHLLPHLKVDELGEEGVGPTPGFSASTVIGVSVCSSFAAGAVASAFWLRRALQPRTSLQVAMLES